MTIFRTVVSWLAFLFLAYRGTLLTVVFVKDRLGIKSLPPPGGPVSFLSPAGPSAGEILGWSFLWSCVALALIWPWLAGLMLRIAGRSPHDRESPFFLWPNRAGRWALALLVAAAFLDWVPRSLEAFLHYNPEEDYGWGDESFPSMLTAAFRGVLAVLLIAPECAALASSGMTGFIDAVFFPGQRDRLPPYTLRLARFYGSQERWQQAEEEYARMLACYPDRLEAWQERLAIAFRRGPAGIPAGEEPEDILAQGLRALKDPAARGALHAAFAAARG